VIAEVKEVTDEVTFVTEVMVKYSM